jgi:hypothetical protein
MADSNVFSRLKRLFSTDVVIRNIGGNQIKVMDTERIQTAGVLQTNALIDRFNRVYTTSNSYAYNLNTTQNYQSMRIQLYADYEAMDTDAIIASALDIISDECTLKNESGEVLQIRSSDENVQKILYNLFYDVLNIEFNLWSWIRNMTKFGDFYLKLEIAETVGVYNVIPFSNYTIVREEGTDLRNPSYVKFKYDPTAVASGASGYIGSYANLLGQSDVSSMYFENYEMAHFRLLGDVNYLPYGRSYLEPGRKLFKQMILMEDAMMIHRIVRAPDKRAYFVNVGAIPPNEVETYMQRMISKMKKIPYVDPQTGQYNLKYNMQNLLEDYFIPVRGNDTATRIETVPGLQYNGIEDVSYLRDKLFAALKIPKAFMGYEKDLTGKATLAAEDIRFARTIERIQRIVLSELTKIALVHLYTQGYTDETLVNFELSLTTPSIIYDQERIALLKEKVALAGDMMEKNLFPADWIYDKIFQLSEDQLNDVRAQILEDKKTKFRYDQIESEGNDPLDTGQAYGTPHQIASLYGGNANYTAAADVPVGYNEKNPTEPIKVPGRPQSKNSFIGTPKDPLGRDRLGTYDMKAKPTGGEDGTLKTKYQGGSPLALESIHTRSVYSNLKSTLDKMTASRKITLFEQSNLLDESSILGDID